MRGTPGFCGAKSMSPRHTFVSRNTDGTWTVSATIVEKFADEIRALFRSHNRTVVVRL
jgi:hypothetical protein